MRSLVSQQARQSISVGNVQIFTAENGRPKIEFPGSKARTLTHRDFATIMAASGSAHKLNGVVRKIVELVDPRAASFAFDA